MQQARNLAWNLQAWLTVRKWVRRMIAGGIAGLQDA
jgi:hypothetical protein